MTHIYSIKCLLKSTFAILLFSSLPSCSELSSNENTSSKTTHLQKEELQIDDVKQKSIVFFGNSLTAGYGLDEGFDFPSLIQLKIDKLQLNYTVVNAGLSGETTSGGKNRIDWILNQPMDVFVLELGANDMLRGFNLQSSRENLHEIISKVKEAKPDTKIIIAGMKAPPNLGFEYTTKFDKMYPNLAEVHQVYLIPFLLKNVAGRQNLNQKDGIHPNIEGQKIVAENIWKVLGPILLK